MVLRYRRRGGRAGGDVAENPKYFPLFFFGAVRERISLSQKYRCTYTTYEGFVLLIKLLSPTMAEDHQHHIEGTKTIDPSVLLPFNTRSPAPQPDRYTTKALLNSLLQKSLRPEPCDVFGSGPLLLSDIPSVIRNNNERGVVMGIDEAGRGPVLGPMTYAAAFWNPVSADSIPQDFNDSKQLTPEKRASLFEQILFSESIGFVLRVLHASEISRNMLRRAPYNLNAMSHDAAIEMIWAVLNAGVRIDTWYVFGCYLWFNLGDHFYADAQPRYLYTIHRNSCQLH